MPDHGFGGRGALAVSNALATEARQDGAIQHTTGELANDLNFYNTMAATNMAVQTKPHEALLQTSADDCTTSEALHKEALVNRKERNDTRTRTRAPHEAAAANADQHSQGSARELRPRL